MNFKKISIAAVLALTGLAANATVVGTLGGITTGSFVALSTANVSGGELYAHGVSVNNIAAAPTLVTSGFYLAGEPLSAPAAAGTQGSATFTLASGSGFVSFDWGSPDAYNVLTVTESDGTTSSFSGSSIAGLVVDGKTDSYVSFIETTVGKSITSLTFASTLNKNAFEAGNFTTAVPEPSNVALMLAGIGLFGFMARKRNV